MSAHKINFGTEKMSYTNTNHKFVFVYHKHKKSYGIAPLVVTRVVSHQFTGSLASIGKLPALAGWYSVWYVRYFLYCKIWRELHFVKFCGNSPQKGDLVHQKGGRSEGKRGSRQMYNAECPYRVFLRYRLGKYRENTN